MYLITGMLSKLHQKSDIVKIDSDGVEAAANLVSGI